MINLYILGVCQRLHVVVSIDLKFTNEEPSEPLESSVVTFTLSVRLKMVRRPRVMLYAELHTL